MLELSGETFSAVYRLQANDSAEAEKMATGICVEQTIEFPPDLVERQDILDSIVGRIASLDSIDDTQWIATIEFPVETAGEELTQLLNVLFGNISLKPGIRLESIDIPKGFDKWLRGPRFGQSGLREILDAPGRPLLATALKPMGLSPVELADQARQFATGGIDLIKDDHGLSNQSFCPFEERVKRCADAVNEANNATGQRSLYFVNVTAPSLRVVERAHIARKAGATGVVLSPGLTGLDVMATLATDDSLELPIMSHPAFQGAFTVGKTAGIGHGALFGQINRLAGADVAIFPSFGGRFSFSKEECRDLVDGTERSMASMKPILPAPAGGMNLGRVQELLKFYGREVVLLIGGDLHRHGENLEESCRVFVDRVIQASHAIDDAV